MWLWFVAAQAGLVINEVMVDPPGADADQHWVELYNDGPTAVDLTGFTLERAKSAWDLSVPLSGVVPAWGWTVIGEPGAPADQVVPLLDFGNAGSSADAVRLRDPGGFVVDTLVYGDPNTDGWADDVRAATTLLAPDPVSGVAIARVADGVDTDDCAADWANLPPTPGSANAPPPPGTCDRAPTTIRINEIFPDPSGLDDGREWIELIHHGFQPLDLSAWEIQAGTSGFTTTGVLPPGTVMVPGQRLVLAQSAIVPHAVVVPGFEMGNAGTNADAVRLVDCAGAVQDTLVYGLPNTDGWLSDDGVPAEPAPAPAAGRSLGRVTDGVDANRDVEDLGEYRVPTPGEDNPLLLTVTPAPLYPGAPMVMTVRGALPGARVHFGVEGAPGAPPCPASLGGLCLSIANPVLLGSARSGIDRHAILTLTVPATLPLGTPIRLQAAETGPDADVSTVWFDTLFPPP